MLSLLDATFDAFLAILGNEFKNGNEMCKKLNGIKKTFIFNYYMYDFI